MNRSLTKIWMDEFLVSGKFNLPSGDPIKICGLCEQSGIITTKANRKFYCICPNGRTIKRNISKSVFKTLRSQM